METINKRVGLLTTAWVKMRTEREYVDFVTAWRKVHDIIVPMIHEHKEAARKEVFSGHHQAMAMKYGRLAKEMYNLRESGKAQLHVGGIERTYEKRKDPALSGIMA